MPRYVCLGAIALRYDRVRPPRRSQLRSSATLIPRVRVAINNEPAERLSFQKWIFASAVVTCALAATIILQLKHREAPIPFKVW